MAILNILTSDFLPQRSVNYPILALLLLTQSSSFKQYFQIKSLHNADSKDLKVLQSEKKYFIVRTPTKAFALANVQVNNEILSGVQAILNPNHEKFLNPIAKVGNLISREDKNDCMEEVHVFTDHSFREYEPVQLEMSQISRLDIYEPDQKAIKQSKFIGFVGLTVAIVTLV